MCLAAFLPCETRVDSLPDSRDVKTLAAALAVLCGPATTDLPADDLAAVDLVDNGTALRILSVLVPILGLACEIEAGPRLRARQG